MTERTVPLSIVLLVAFCSASAAAHTVLTAPEPRLTGMAGSGLKARPCGRGPDEPRSETVTTFQAGETITVSWHETIPHPGYWRISFDDDGQDFVDPPAPRATGYSETVLADVIYPSTPAEAAARWGQDNLYSFEITLPDTACDTCTLQLIQFMEDKLADANPDNDIYYSCADLVLVMAAVDDAAAEIDATTTEVDGAPTEVEAIGPDAAEPEAAGPEADDVHELGSEAPGVADVDARPSGDAGGSCAAGGRPPFGAWFPLLLGLPLLAVARLGRTRARALTSCSPRRTTGAPRSTGCRS